MATSACSWWILILAVLVPPGSFLPSQDRPKQAVAGAKKLLQDAGALAKQGKRSLAIAKLDKCLGQLVAALPKKPKRDAGKPDLDTAQLFLDLSRAAEQLGAGQTALKAWPPTIAILQQIGAGPVFLVRARYQLARWQIESGDPSAARDMLRKAENDLVRVKEKRSQTHHELSLNVGTYWLQLGDLNRAQARIEPAYQALSARNWTGVSSQQQQSVVGVYAALLQRSGDLDRAASVALGCIRRLGDQVQDSDAVMNLAAMLMDLRRYQDAEEVLDLLAKARNERLKLDLRLMRAQVACLRKQYGQALSLAKSLEGELEASGDARLKRRASYVIAVAEAEGGSDLAGGLARMRKIVNALEGGQQGSSELENARITFGSMLASSGEMQQARQQMLQAAGLAHQRTRMLTRSFTRRTRERSREQMRDLLSSLYSCRHFSAKDKGEWDREDLEARLRFMGLSEREGRRWQQIAGLREKSRNVDAAARRYEAARTRYLVVAENGGDLSAADAEVERRELELLQLLPESMRQESASETDIAELAKWIPAGTAVLVTVAYKRYPQMQQGKPQGPPADRIAGFVLNHKGRVQRLELGLAADMGPSIEVFRRGLMRRVKGGAVTDARGGRLPGGVGKMTFKVAANKLGRIVARLLAAVPDDTQRLLICPDGVLATIPWEALVVEGKVLYKRFQITYGQSPSDLRPRQKINRRDRLFLVGDVDYGHGKRGDRWRRLANSLAETEAIQAIFKKVRPNGEVRYYKGAKATRKAFLDGVGDCAFVHLAIHAHAGGAPAAKTKSTTQAATHRRGLNAGLVFANANALGRQGELSAFELSSLDLSQCELAVLSACDTNVGSRGLGEAVTGLNRALKLAGVRNTVTSLWPVSDQGAAAFFQAFYAELWGKKPCTVPEAMKRARQKVRDRGYGEGVWAAFVLYGQPGS